MVAAGLTWSALGAPRGRVRRRVLGVGLTIAPFDPATYAAVIGTVLVATTLGVLPAAVRASRVDPNRVLQAD